MNILFFLIPKEKVAYVDNSATLRQVLEKMRVHRYTTIPVITHDGKYDGVLSEGDLLYYMVDQKITTEQTETINLKKVKRSKVYTPIKIDANIEDLIDLSTQQNFIPIIDDFNHFIGIVTRKDIILQLKKYLSDHE